MEQVTRLVAEQAPRVGAVWDDAAPAEEVWQLVQRGMSEG